MIAIFGGYGYSANATSPRRLNDLIFLDPVTNSIRSYFPPSLEGPPPRVFGGMCALKDGLLLFGGRKNPNCAFNDCWFFDFSTNHWIQFPAISSFPAARWNYGLVSVNAHVALLYGGRDVNQVFGDCWSVFVKKNPDSTFECKWFLLYDSHNTIYNNNESPNVRFSPLLTPVWQQGICDEVLIWGGIKSLTGECRNSSSF